MNGTWKVETISRMLSRHEKMCVLPHLGFKMPCSHAFVPKKETFLFLVIQWQTVAINGPLMITNDTKCPQN